MTSKHNIDGNHNIIVGDRSIANIASPNSTNIISNSQFDYFALFDSLPTGIVPVPAALPMGSRIEYPVNPAFVGRDKELCQLAQSLKGTEATVTGSITAITGLGGIGKSQLASEFAHRYGQYFAGGVFWLGTVNLT